MVLPYFTKLTSAGLLDPVTSLIPHHRPDWLSPPGLCFVGDLAVKGERRADLIPSVIPRTKWSILSPEFRPEFRKDTEPGTFNGLLEKGHLRI